MADYAQSVHDNVSGIVTSVICQWSQRPRCTVCLLGRTLAAKQRNQALCLRIKRAHMQCHRFCCHKVSLGLPASLMCLEEAVMFEKCVNLIMQTSKASTP